jgi:hypothetical protein
MAIEYVPVRRVFGLNRHDERLTLLKVPTEDVSVVKGEIEDGCKVRQC